MQIPLRVSSDLPLCSDTKSVYMIRKKNQCFRKKNLYEEGQYEKKPLAFQKNKICILPNFKGKKSVYTDKVGMSGRSVSFSPLASCRHSNMNSRDI